MNAPTRIATALTLLGAAAGTHADAFAPGDPITAENAPLVAELVRLADTLDAAVDAKAWETARALFTDQIDVDFTSLVGGEPATIPADALIEAWSTNLAAEKTSYHQSGNHLVTLEGSDRATEYRKDKGRSVPASRRRRGAVARR